MFCLVKLCVAPHITGVIVINSQAVDNFSPHNVSLSCPTIVCLGMLTLVSLTLILTNLYTHFNYLIFCFTVLHQSLFFKILDIPCKFLSFFLLMPDILIVLVTLHPHYFYHLNNFSSVPYVLIHQVLQFLIFFS